MGRLPRTVDRAVLVDTSTSDDAGVYLWREDLALVQTVDFFPPMVDDPRAFGRIAATNALSDVWAMGGVPRTALNLFGFPFDDLPLDVAAAILEGGSEVCREHGVVILGGHTTDEEVPRYGLAVTGEVPRGRIHRNVGARAGDWLVLTKPLGSGLLTGACMKDLLEEQDLEEALRWMTTPNRWAAEALAGLDVHALTDVTGYGLLGHLREMLQPGDLEAHLWWEEIPVMTLVPAVLERWTGTGGGLRNLGLLGEKLQVEVGVPSWASALLADPQTSGGLLAALPPEDAEAWLEALARRGAFGWVVGRLEPGAGRILVEAGQRPHLPSL